MADGQGGWTRACESSPGLEVKRINRGILAVRRGILAIRNSEDVGGALTLFNQREWTEFLEAVKQGRFDSV